MSNVSNTKLRLQCTDRCPIDCYEEIYFPKLLFRDESGNQSLSMAVNDPEYKIMYTASLTLSAFVIYIAGILSIWFGFSMYTTAGDMVQMLKRKCSKKFI